MKNWRIVRKMRIWLDRSRLSHNTSQKLISLIFAILLWFFVMDQVNPEMTRDLENVRVQVLNKTELTQNGLILMEPQRDYFVDIKVSGRRNDVLAASNTDVMVIADLAGYGKGTNSVPLDIKSVNSSIVIEDASQKDIKVILDRIVEVQKPIHLELLGETATGYVRGELGYTPQDIFVKGPESIVNRVAMIYGETSIEALNSTLSMEVPVRAVDMDKEPVHGITMARDYIRIDLPVFKLRTISLEPRVSGQVEPGYEVVKKSVNPAAVTIKGFPEHIDGINRIYTRPVDVTGLKRSGTYEVVLDLPENVSAPYLKTPPLVDIKVEAVESRVYQFDIQEIPIVNLTEGYSSNIAELTGTIDVTLKDVTSVLDDVQKQDIELYIDGASLVLGTGTPEIMTRMGTVVKQVTIVPQTIELIVVEKEIESPQSPPEDGGQDPTGGQASPPADQTQEPGNLENPTPGNGE